VSKQPTETPEQQRNREIVESIAKNIAALARAVDSLLHGPLRRQALVVLLSHSAKVNKETVNAVLDALSGLEKDWLNK